MDGLFHLAGVRLVCNTFWAQSNNSAWDLDLLRVLGLRYSHVYFHLICVPKGTLGILSSCLAGDYDEVIPMDKDPNVLPGVMKMIRAGGSSDEPSLDQGVGVVLAPSRGSVQRPIHGLFKLTTYPRLPASGILLLHMDVYIPHYVSVKVCSLDVGQEDLVGIVSPSSAGQRGQL